MSTVIIVGAGLAGCEAALQCARRGVPVRLSEMRPEKMTEAHETGDVAELVCSNSLKSDEQTNAHGLLKAELRILGSVLLECAERARVPGGKALVVDRRRFSREVQAELTRAGVTIERAEVSSLPSVAGENGNRPEPDSTTKTPRHQGESAGGRQDSESRETPPGGWCGLASVGTSRRGDVEIIATGPLTSQAMVDALQSLLSSDLGHDPKSEEDFGHVPRRLFFYDAIAPIVSADSLDMTKVFEGSRYGAGSDYLNCPMTEEEYGRFVQAMLEAELHPLHEFEKPQFFEGCLPVEEIARRGRLALAYGPMKPVGLVDPRTGKRPFAVVQLRRENAEGTMYNLVGFQTRLRQAEQECVFRMIPGLEQAGFLRFGSIHRNTYLDSPKLLLPTLQMRKRPDLLVAGQLTGVEGYVESIGAGLVAGINAARLALGEQPLEIPRDMMLGSLLAYVSASQSSEHDPDSAEGIGSRPARFQPMNSNFGLLPALEKRLRGREKRSALAERALEAARGFALTLVEDRA